MILIPREAVNSRLILYALSAIPIYSLFLPFSFSRTCRGLLAKNGLFSSADKFLFPAERFMVLLENKDSAKARRKALAGELPKRNLDCALISNPKHIFYFTGFPSNLNMAFTLGYGPKCTSFLVIDAEGEGFLLVGRSEISNPWISDSEIKAEQRIFEVDVSTYVDYDLRTRMITYGDVLCKEMKKWIKYLHSNKQVKLKNVGIEDWHLPDLYRTMLSDSIRSPNLSGISETILSMRKSKGRDEITYLKQATEMIDFAYQFAHSNVKVGESELDLYRKMNYETFEKYGHFGWIIGDTIISGQRSLGIAGWPTERKLKEGDTVVLDLQAESNNYWSDLARTFIVGKPNEKQTLALNTLIEAKQKAENLLKPGTKGKEIYDIVSSEITKAGYPKLPHHACHAIGLDVQEGPFFIPASNEELEEGMVCVIEPGIYVEAIGGMRIEDCYVITQNGYEKVSKFPLGA